MGNYISSTKSQSREMLEEIGLSSMNELYGQVPGHLLLHNNLDIPEGRAEMEVYDMLKKTADKNHIFPVIFRGAGAYRHYIPAIVDTVVSKETFLTAYTPYQAEISQGILQSIFEYQTMICELTGMSASNASVYDGATAAAEAVAMCRERKRTKALISAAAHPDVIETIRTYCWSAGTGMELIPVKDGKTDLSALKNMLDETTACVYIGSPNYFGMLEEVEEAGALIHEKGAKYIMGVNPIAASILKTPRECGADIAVGEGQPLGMHLGFGGPYLGFMAATKAMTRKLPGRIVGETFDSRGNRAYVLTLQAREQHIRREKASSNICSNQALCAMTAAVYMAVMGPEGMQEAAYQCMSKAHYLADELEKAGFSLKYTGEFFHEFVTESPVDVRMLMEYLEQNGILGGLPVENGILWCTTEMNRKEDMDRLIHLIREVSNNGTTI